MTSRSRRSRLSSRCALPGPEDISIFFRTESLEDIDEPELRRIVGLIQSSIRECYSTLNQLSSRSMYKVRILRTVKMLLVNGWRWCLELPSPANKTLLTFGLGLRSIETLFSFLNCLVVYLRESRCVKKAIQFAVCVEEQGICLVQKLPSPSSTQLRKLYATLAKCNLNRATVQAEFSSDSSFVFRAVQRGVSMLKCCLKEVEMRVRRSVEEKSEHMFIELERLEKEFKSLLLALSRAIECQACLISSLSSKVASEDLLKLSESMFVDEKVQKLSISATQTRVCLESSGVQTESIEKKSEAREIDFHLNLSESSEEEVSFAISSTSSATITTVELS